jgi:hypothetical protein
MEKEISFYKKELEYNEDDNLTRLIISYDFHKNLDIGIRKKVKKRLHDFDGILKFIEKNENVKETLFLEREYYLDDINGNERTVYIYRPNLIDKIYLRLNLKIIIIDKHEEKELFDANRLEKYLLSGKQ